SEGGDPRDRAGGRLTSARRARQAVHGRPGGREQQGQREDRERPARDQAVAQRDVRAGSVLRRGGRPVEGQDGREGGAAGGAEGVARDVLGLITGGGARP